MVAPHRRRAFVLAECVYVLGAAAMFASAFLYWVSDGPGSGLRGHDLIDAVVALGKHVPALSAGRLTVVWYLVPALGAGALIACGLRGARSRVARGVGLAALIVVLLVVVAFVRMVGVADLGWGPKVALAGAVLTCFGAWARLPGRMTARAGSSVVRAGDS